MNRPLEAFEDSEHTKSRIFAESMSKRSESTSFDIPQISLKKDQELNDQLAALKKRRQEGYEKAVRKSSRYLNPRFRRWKTHSRHMSRCSERSIRSLQQLSILNQWI